MSYLQLHHARRPDDLPKHPSLSVSAFPPQIHISLSGLCPRPKCLPNVDHFLVHFCWFFRSAAVLSSSSLFAQLSHAQSLKILTCRNSLWPTNCFFGRRLCREKKFTSFIEKCVLILTIWEYMLKMAGNCLKIFPWEGKKKVRWKINPSKIFCQCPQKKVPKIPLILRMLVKSYEAEKFINLGAFSVSCKKPTDAGSTQGWRMLKVDMFSLTLIDLNGCHGKLFSIIFLSAVEDSSRGRSSTRLGRLCKREESSKQKIFKEGILSAKLVMLVAHWFSIFIVCSLHCCWVQLASLVFPAVALVILPGICETAISSAVMTFFPPRLWQCFLGMTSF